MQLFAQFFSWLDSLLTTYVSAKTLAVASAIEPVAVTLATIYVMLWGAASVLGAIEEPIVPAVKRMLVLALVLGVGIKLWAYHAVVTDTFFRAPDQLAASIVKSMSTVSVLDKVWIDGNLVAEELLKKGSLLSGDFAYYLAGFFVYLLVGLTVAYVAFLFALSKVAVALIVSLGPIFIVLLLFDTTKRFFESWVAQLANYGLITILSVMAAAIMLAVVSSYAANAAAQTSGITIAESVRLCITSVLVFLVMRQVMPIASGLASGIALSSFGAVSGLLTWGLRSGRRTGYEFGRGVIDGMRHEPISRWDSLRRGAGNLVGSGVSRLGGGERIGGTLVPRERVMPHRNHNV